MEINGIPRKVALALRAITQIESPDRTPVAIPEGFGTPLSLEDRLRMFVRQELSQAASEEGRETFDEADDLEFEEEDALLSPFQVQDMAEEYLAESETGREERPGSEAGEDPQEPSLPAEKAADNQPPTEPAQQAPTHSGPPTA